MLSSWRSGYWAVVSMLIITSELHQLIYGDCSCVHPGFGLRRSKSTYVQYFVSGVGSKLRIKYLHVPTASAQHHKDCGLLDNVMKTT